MTDTIKPLVVLTHKCYDIGLCPQTGRYRIYVTGTGVLASPYIHCSPAMAVEAADKLLRDAKLRSEALSK